MAPTVKKPAKHYWDRFLVYVTNHLISRVVFSKVRLVWYRRVMKFQIGAESSILTDFKVARRGNLRIGNNTVVNNGCRFDNRFRIELGNNVSVSYGTKIFTKGHDITCPDFSTNGDVVKLEDYSWICAEAILLPGVTVGKGAVVLTGAVVPKSVEAFAVVGGNPAAKVSERPQNQRYQLHWDPWVPFFG